MTLYLLDTNVISDMLALQQHVARHITERLATADTLGLCLPVHYELLRGLYWRNANVKLQSYLTQVLPLLKWVDLIAEDWEQAAHFWAAAQRSGKQLSDPDFLLTALVYRQNAVLVSADADFDALPVQRENWRLSN